MRNRVETTIRPDRDPCLVCYGSVALDGHEQNPKLTRIVSPTRARHSASAGVNPDTDEALGFEQVPGKRKIHDNTSRR